MQIEGTKSPVKLRAFSHTPIAIVHNANKQILCTVNALQIVHEDGSILAKGSKLHIAVIES